MDIVPGKNSLYYINYQDTGKHAKRPCVFCPPPLKNLAIRLLLVYIDYYITRPFHLPQWMYIFFLAVGCETFADGSSIIILNNTECEEKSEYLGEKSEYLGEKSEYSGEKGIDLRKTSCSLLPHKSEYLHDDTWKPLEMKNGSFSIKTMDKVSLQVQYFNEYF